MDFRVPPDCKDSPFHHKWRLYLLEQVKGELFWHQPDEVRKAVKKFLDHPTSLPYDHDKVMNFLTNSMIIVDKELLGRTLEWFRVIRVKFFDFVKKGSFVPASELPVEPPLMIKPRRSSSISTSASSVSAAFDLETDNEAKSEISSVAESKRTKFEVLMAFPAKWPWRTVVKHVHVMREDISTERIDKVNCCVTKISFDCADEMIELLKKDLQTKFSIFGNPRPRMFVTRESVQALPTVTVQITADGVNFNRDLVSPLTDQLEFMVGGVRVINMFHDWDGFVAILESPGAVDELISLNVKDMVLDGVPYPVIVSRGF